MLHRGTVRRAAGGIYEVELDVGGVVDAVLRGRLKREQRTGDRVVVGDRVGVEQHADGSVTIETVDERRSELARRAPGQGARRAKVIVANVDQVVVVFAAAHPEPRLRMLDRFLVLAEANDLPALVVVNKIDLVGLDSARDRFADYEAAGYPVLYTSAGEGVGIAALRERLCDRIAILADGRIQAMGDMASLREQAAAGAAGLEEIFLKVTGGGEVEELIASLRDEPQPV